MTYSNVMYTQQKLEFSLAAELRIAPLAGSRKDALLRIDAAGRNYMTTLRRCCAAIFLYAVSLLSPLLLSGYASAATDSYWTQVVMSVRSELARKMNANGQLTSPTFDVDGLYVHDFRAFLASQYGRQRDCGTADYLWPGLMASLVAQFGSTDELRRNAFDAANKAVESAYRWSESVGRDDPQCRNLPISQHFQNIMNTLHASVADAPRVAIAMHKEWAERAAQNEALRRAKLEKQASDNAEKKAAELRERETKQANCDKNFASSGMPPELGSRRLLVTGGYIASPKALVCDLTASGIVKASYIGPGVLAKGFGFSLKKGSKSVSVHFVESPLRSDYILVDKVKINGDEYRVGGNPQETMATVQMLYGFSASD